MFRKLMATTALVGLMTTGAFAQDAAQPGAATAPAATQAPSPMAGGAASASATDYLRTLGPDQHLASRLTGQTVYAGDAQDAATIGEIRNFMLDRDGRVAAAIMDLTAGDQRRTVAVPFDQVKFKMNGERDMRATLTDADALATLPVFTLPEQADARSAGNAAVTPGTGIAPAATTGGAGSVETAANVPAQSPASDAPSSVGADQYLTQDIIGSDVASAAGADARDLGKISDLVVASSGRVDAAIVGVGGFLGIGAKDVAVPFDALQIAREGENDIQLSMNTSREQLEQAPTFDEDGSDTNLAATGAATGAAIGTAAENARQSASNAANETGARLGNAAESARQEISDAAADAQTALGNAADRIGEAASNAGTAVRDTADDAQQSAENAVNRAGEAADDAAASTAAATGAAAGTAASAPDATTTASTGGSNRADLSPVTQASELTADNLLGTDVYGPNDENVGDIGDIALNPSGQVDAVIVDVGGFLGIGEKPVAVSMENLQFMRDSGGKLYLYTQFTQDQLNSAPEYNRDTYAQNRDTMRLETAPATGGAATAPASGQAN